MCFVVVYEFDLVEWVVVLMMGLGMVVVESMIVVFVLQDGKLFVIENGVYGEWIMQIVMQYGIVYDVLKYEWMQVFDFVQIGVKFDVGGYLYVVVIYYEMMMGWLNDFGVIVEVCCVCGVKMFVDGVSSFGVEVIDFVGGVIDVVVVIVNKCLYGVLGVVFVIVCCSVFMKGVSWIYYFDFGWFVKLQDQWNMLFMFFVYVYYVFVEVLCEFDEVGGWCVWYVYYKVFVDQVQVGFVVCGMLLVLLEGVLLVVLCVYWLLQGVMYEMLYDGLKVCGFVIYVG